MQLDGQARRTVGSNAGYAMAALLVAMAIMAILMTVAMPVWKQAAQREKEEELVFRGQQYVHAIALFSRKSGNAVPPNVNVLVEQRFLRKKYKDPITNDDFQLIPVGAQGTGAISGPQGGTSSQPGAFPGAGQRTGGAGGRGSSPAPAAGREPSPASPGGPGGSPQGSTAGRAGSLSTFNVAPMPGAGGRGTTLTGGVGGFIGVTSKSKEKSIRLYNGRNHYNEWAFVFTAQNQAPGAGGAPGAGAPGQRGQRGQPGQPGQRGFPGPTAPGRGQPPPGGRGPGRNPFLGGVSPFDPQQPPPPSRGRSDR
jgi:type II secretory pathway pseudopilin PulG